MWISKATESFSYSIIVIVWQLPYEVKLDILKRVWKKVI